MRIIVIDQVINDRFVMLLANSLLDFSSLLILTGLFLTDLAWHKVSYSHPKGDVAHSYEVCKLTLAHVCHKPLSIK
jgi:hypothetical protein